MSKEKNFLEVIADEKFDETIAGKAISCYLNRKGRLNDYINEGDVLVHVSIRGKKHWVFTDASWIEQELLPQHETVSSGIGKVPMPISAFGRPRIHGEGDNGNEDGKEGGDGGDRGADISEG